MREKIRSYALQALLAFAAVFLTRTAGAIDGATAWGEVDWLRLLDTASFAGVSAAVQTLLRVLIESGAKAGAKVKAAAAKSAALIALLVLALGCRPAVPNTAEADCLARVGLEEDAALAGCGFDEACAERVFDRYDVEAVQCIERY